MTTIPLSLTHLVRPSSITSGNAPVLIMLHGYGSDENDLFSFASELPKELLIISARAPYQLQPQGNAWYAINFDAVQGKFSDNEQAKESRIAISNFIDEVIENYPVDKENLTLLGFSQGTILSYAVALSEPSKVKNVIALSGYINTEIITPRFKGNDFSRLSIYASHGSQDQVIPVSWARKAPELLKELGIKHTYSEFPVGHGVHPQNFSELKKWLEDRL
ncbi:phospholipase/carboxylesterase [Gillisia mitskevichiae]|uniref:Phospholipase/carboxylesterase n=1 Tax=Gillisia mitskevichiae TaxID=270921 RepID=A0A495PU47_9FLAO|nr:alpha/beta hydrolase-fold protein [Gillisia mitskevichiae]RKS53270.1 phospholipase/carboxylesterase [Gillisia mitskevichiae]